MATDKIIVTNFRALQKKYGPAGTGRVRAAVNALIARDSARGLTSKLVDLGNAQTMTAAGAAPVQNPADPQQNKNAVDAVYNRYTPDYILLLGGPDVIPHQDLTNPIYNPTTATTADPDPVVYSDLPYACPGGYSKRIAGFINPTRVIARLPDVAGGTDPAYLEKLLATAANYAPADASAYRSFLGVSAEIWSASTSLSLTAAFGTAAGMNDVPPSASTWPAGTLAAPSHFFNCHGAPSRPEYYGQSANPPDTYPVACDAAYVAGKIKGGTVAAAECCYGAELYDPSATGRHHGIANQYLEDGAYGFFGSTTVAYGPASTNDWADLLCQYFFQSVLAGASVGRAALQARQKYIQRKPHLTGTDLEDAGAVHHPRRPGGDSSGRPARARGDGPGGAHHHVPVRHPGGDRGHRANLPSPEPHAERARPGQVGEHPQDD